MCRLHGIPDTAKPEVVLAAEAILGARGELTYALVQARKPMDADDFIVENAGREGFPETWQDLKTQILARRGAHD